MELALVAGNILEFIYFPPAISNANCLSSFLVIVKNRGEIHTAGDLLFFNRGDQNLV